MKNPLEMIFISVGILTVLLLPPALARPEPPAVVQQFERIDGVELPQVPFGMLRWNFSSTFFLDGAGCSRPALLQVTTSMSESPGKVPLGESSLHTGAISRYWDDEALAQAVTPRAGLAHHEVNGDKAYVFIRLEEDHGNQDDADQEKQLDIPAAGDTTVSGYSVQENFCGHGQAPVRQYFHITFDQPIAAVGWHEQVDRRGNGEIKSRREFLRLSFDLPADTAIDSSGQKRRVLKYKLGLSYTATDAAAANAAAEVPGWDVVEVQHAAAAAWNRRLDALQLVQAPDWLRTHFRKNIVKVLAHPNVYSNADGTFLGFDGQIHQAREGNTIYHIFSSWDTYRTHQPLVAALWPDVAEDIAQSLVYQADTGRGGFPRWSIGNQETGTMQGDPSPIMISTAHAFGATDFDQDAALNAMVRSATTPFLESSPGYFTRPGLYEYLTQGHTKFEASASYTRSDFAIARMAHRMGREDVAERMLRQANNFKSLASDTGKMLVDRDWDQNVDRIKSQKYHGLNGEGTHFQYQFHPDHNLAFTWETFGGREWAEKKVDAHVRKMLPKELISYTAEDQEVDHFKLWFGKDTVFHPWNEHAFSTVMLYNWLGKPYKTQALARATFMNGFTKPNKKGGYDWTRPGQEDLGSMNSWAIWLAIGLYPAPLGEAALTIGSPLVGELEMQLGPGRSLHITAHDAAPDRPYIQKMTLNGQPHTSSWLPLDKLNEGENTIEFWMAAEPNKQWGAADADLPPSFDAEPLYKDVTPADLPRAPDYAAK